MSIGTDQWMNWVINEEKALPLLKAALDRGVNTWDTGKFVLFNGPPNCMLNSILVPFSDSLVKPMSTPTANPKGLLAKLSRHTISRAKSSSS